MGEQASEQAIAVQRGECEDGMKCKVLKGPKRGSS